MRTITHIRIYILHSVVGHILHLTVPEVDGHTPDPIVNMRGSTVVIKVMNIILITTQLNMYVNLTSKCAYSNRI